MTLLEPVILSLEVFLTQVSFLHAVYRKVLLDCPLLGGLSTFGASSGASSICVVGLHQSIILIDSMEAHSNIRVALPP